MMRHSLGLPAAARARGFTLIELMIVVVIVAILAAVAYPSYRNSVLKGRRSDATISLIKLAQRLERCHTQFGSYKNAGCSVQTTNGADSDEGYYSIAIAFGAKTDSFTLTATPTSKGAQDDDVCQKYTLDETGERGAVDASGSNLTDTCW